MDSLILDGEHASKQLHGELVRLSEFGDAERERVILQEVRYVVLQIEDLHVAVGLAQLKSEVDARVSEGVQFCDQNPRLRKLLQDTPRRVNRGEQTVTARVKLFTTLARLKVVHHAVVDENVVERKHSRREKMVEITVTDGLVQDQRSRDAEVPQDAQCSDGNG